jgi:hypothetical protein
MSIPGMMVLCAMEVRRDEKARSAIWRADRDITDESATYSLVGTGQIDKAAIISAAGDSVWATTSGFTVRNILSHEGSDAEAGGRLSKMISLTRSQPD